MTAFALDASVALAWVMREARSAVCEPLFREAMRDGAAAPILWRAEVGNVLLISERRGRIDPRQHDAARATLEELGVELDDGAFRGGDMLVPLARRHRLTLYDAAYLELALRRHLPLATLDAELRAAAADEGVATLP
ncbi:MAG: type II toxin-antitoxin system VapC family toxin [Acetobacteraceae bacterium]|nr:type II toxin-antitoxin system VapC family toxin [Acetobacteraceae bacterium]